MFEHGNWSGPITISRVYTCPLIHYGDNVKKKFTMERIFIFLFFLFWVLQYPCRAYVHVVFGLTKTATTCALPVPRKQHVGTNFTNTTSYSISIHVAHFSTSSFAGIQTTQQCYFSPEINKFSPHANSEKFAQNKNHMALTTVFTVFLFLSAVATSSPATITDDAATVYDALEDFNFPVGLIPKGAVGYDLDQTTGKFHAYLNGSCSFSLEGSYELRYKSTIGGYISKNRLTSLTGISVKILFLWLNIVEVVRSGNNLEFSVGIASASFPLDNFFECPQCGCGLDCVNGQVRKFKLNPFVSSS